MKKDKLQSPKVELVGYWVPNPTGVMKRKYISLKELKGTKK